MLQPSDHEIVLLDCQYALDSGEMAAWEIGVPGESRQLECFQGMCDNQGAENVASIASLEILYEVHPP